MEGSQNEWKKYPRDLYLKNLEDNVLSFGEMYTSHMCLPTPH